MKNSYLFIIAGVAILIVLYFFGNPYSRLVNYPPKNAVIVAFGDSLIFGKGSTKGNDFVSDLGKLIGKPIINLGVSGNTTYEGLTRMNEIYVSDPGTVILLLGGNDYIRNVPKDETFKNLQEIIARLQAKGIFVVLLGVRGGAINDHFEGSFENLAKETGVAYVPDVLDGLIGDSRYMSDVVHPNDLGYLKMAQKVYETVGKYLK